jgi:flagellar biosynthesis anti-sigma factor FlgM
MKGILMNIKKVASYLTGAIQNPREAAQKASGDNKAAQANGVSSDRVQLSKDYQDLAQANKVSMSRNDVRADKVDQVRSALDSGNYAINPDGIAGKMLDEAML